MRSPMAEVAPGKSGAARRRARAAGASPWIAGNEFVDDDTVERFSHSERDAEVLDRHLKAPHLHRQPAKVAVEARVVRRFGDGRQVAKSFFFVIKKTVQIVLEARLQMLVRNECGALQARGFLAQLPCAQVFGSAQLDVRAGHALFDELGLQNQSTQFAAGFDPLDVVHLL